MPQAKGLIPKIKITNLCYLFIAHHPCRAALILQLSSTRWQLTQRNPRHSYHTTPHLLRTVNQIIRQGPVKQKRRRKVGPMSGRTQLKGAVLQVMNRKPRKPNSAQRKCCRVRLSTGKEVTAYIPGEGHTLQEHNVVLVEGGRTQDLPGVNVRVVRGKYDCGHPQK